MEHNGNGNGHANGHYQHVTPAPRPIPLPDQSLLCNLEAERSTLGCILFDDAVMTELMEILVVGDFFRAAHQMLYQAFLDMYERGVPIDCVTTPVELRKMGRWEELGEDDFLTEIVNSVPHAANFKYYAGIVGEYSAKRKQDAAAAEYIRDRDSNQFTAAELITRHTARITALEHSIDAQEDENDFAFSEMPYGLDPAALQGVTGHIAKMIEPHTEACIESVVLQFLVAFGSMIGRRPHWRHDASRHNCALYLCMVGPTGCGKGIAWGGVKWLLSQCDERWKTKEFLAGITSGEGLIKEVKDCPGPLLAVETEFSRLMGNMARKDNSLSSVLRQAWDGSVLYVPTKNNSIKAPDPHFSLIAHCTPSDLKSKIDRNEIENGLVNRFMWGHAYFARELPFGGDTDSIRQVLAPCFREVQGAADFGQMNVAMENAFDLDKKAKELWASVYRTLRVRPPTAYGSATARAAPIVRRLAVIYACLDREFDVQERHLKAALACWDYCDRTAGAIFGNPVHDAKMGKLISALESAEAGLSRTQISARVFHGHLSKEEINRLIQKAMDTGQILYSPVKTQGRTKQLWIHKRQKRDKKENSEKSERAKEDCKPSTGADL